jgi:hypothetical protein
VGLVSIFSLPHSRQNHGYWCCHTVQPIFLNGFDARIACGFVTESPCEGGLKSGIAIGFSQPHEPQTGTEGLLTIKPGREDAFGNSSIGGTSHCGPPDHPLWFPFRIDLMGLGHVFFDDGMPASKESQGIRRRCMCFDWISCRIWGRSRRLGPSPLAGDDDQLSCKMKAECSAKLILNNSNLSNFNKFRLSMLENEFDTKS